MRLPPVLRPLRDPALALLWAGLATSALGDQLFLVALSWTAVRALGADAGYLTALQPAVILAVALLGGRFADRREPRRLMIAADLARAGILVPLVGLWLIAGDPPAWSLIVAVVVLSGGHALFRPALQAVIPPLVGDPAGLGPANGLLETTDRIARLLGPGLISLLGARLPLVHFVTLDAATFLASAGAVAGLRRRRSWPPMVAAPQGMLAAVTQGFCAMRTHPVLGFSLVVNTGQLAGLWWAAMFVGVPLLTARPGGGGLAGFGLVTACYGLTNLLGTMIFGGVPLSRRPGRLVFGGDIVLGAGLSIMGLAGALLPPPWVLPGLCAGAALAAFGAPMADIPLAVLRQTRLSLADQAAAMRAVLVAINLGVLVALTGASALIRAVGPGSAILLAGSIMMAAGITGLLRHGGPELAPAHPALAHP